MGNEGVLIHLELLDGRVGDVLVEPEVRTPLDQHLIDPALQMALAQRLILQHARFSTRGQHSLAGRTSLLLRGYFTVLCLLVDDELVGVCPADKMVGVIGVIIVCYMGLLALAGNDPLDVPFGNEGRLVSGGGVVHLHGVVAVLGVCLGGLGGQRMLQQ